MPISSIVSRIPRLSLLAGAMILGVGCAGRLPAPATSGDLAQTPLPAAAVTPAPSIFDIPDYWYSQHTGAARLASLSGGLLVVGFVDNDCEATCTATLTAMRAIERETDAGVHFVLVARSSANGTPETLAAFAKAKHLSPNRYTIVSGNTEAMGKLVAAVDVRGADANVAGLESASMLSVLDYNGILVQQRGYGVVAPIIEALTLLSNIR